ncbi:MAG: cbb3-type cytochrome oxidase assembly protein CcoS [Magnetococcales bacterium]|nr:cbb3-type cytochrome oxidase assembly protein CcoS [Magnetococcales bacterium]
MNTVYLLLPIAIILGLIGLALMIWAVRNGQFDDMEGPKHRILYDDDQDMMPPSVKSKKREKEPVEMDGK